MMTRRDLRRQQTIDDIKDTARHQLANGGPAGISMRAIADSGMTEPGLVDQLDLEPGLLADLTNRSGGGILVVHVTARVDEPNALG